MRWVKQMLKTIFNEEVEKDYDLKTQEVVKQNKEGESITFFQQVRINDGEKRVLHVSSSKY